MSSPTRPHARAVFAVVDSMDVAALGSLFAESGRLTYGNNAPLVGLQEIRRGATLFLETISGLHHTIVNEWHVDGEIIAELKVTYDRKDGQQVTIPCVTIYHCDGDGKIDDYRVYFDVAPIYA
jgi:ketosteroid isomerase-like protein